MTEITAANKNILEENSNKIFDNIMSVIKDVNKATRSSYVKEKIAEQEKYIYEAKVDNAFHRFIQIDELLKHAKQPKFYHSSEKKQKIQENLAFWETKREESIENFKKIALSIPDNMNRDEISRLVSLYFEKFEIIAETEII